VTRHEVLPPLAGEGRLALTEQELVDWGTRMGRQINPPLLVTLDGDLAQKLEPRASSPMGRLRIIRELSAAGVPVSVNIAPIIPGLTDTELPQILKAISEAGARRAAFFYPGISATSGRWSLTGLCRSSLTGETHPIPQRALPLVQR